MIIETEEQREESTSMNKKNGKNSQNTARGEELAFQADTSELLSLMVNSIYTHKQIFLRELLSNASDAIDKLRFLSLSNSNLLSECEEFNINLEIDEDAKTLSITDNGIGMSYQEVIENIGTIAKSGTRKFLEQLDESRDMDLIGQFGVGFYSSFMVADKVRVLTRGYDQSDGILWESEGDGKFTIRKTEKKERGTKITLFLRGDASDKSAPLKDFSNHHTISNLVEQYSNYIQYPIKMDMLRNEPPRDNNGVETTDGEWTTVIENRVLNSMTPIWKKNRKDVNDEDYSKFYKHHFKDWNDYTDVIHIKVEGKTEFYALLYIPSRASNDLYSKEYSRGIELYSNSIFVMDDCKDLLPEHLRFVRGLVDSSNFSLNISRETLQHDSQLKTIAGHLEKKVLSTLKKLLENNRQRYDELWSEFGKSIKGGIYMDVQNREKLKDLLLFKSSYNDGAYTTLREYVERMRKGQNEIYYAAGKDVGTIERMPQLEMFKEKGVEILYFLDKIDEFIVSNLGDYDEMNLLSVTREDFNLDSINTSASEGKQANGSDVENMEESRKKEGDDISVQNENDENKEKSYSKLLDSVTDILSGKVKNVRLSKRLKSSAVCLVTSNSGASFNMEQLLKGVGQNATQVTKILEINPDHELFDVLQNTYKNGEESPEFSNCCTLIYSQAMLIEGYELDDPVEFSCRLTELLVNAYSAKKTESIVSSH